MQADWVIDMILAGLCLLTMLLLMLSSQREHKLFLRHLPWLEKVVYRNLLRYLGLFLGVAGLWFALLMSQEGYYLVLYFGCLSAGAMLIYLLLLAYRRFLELR